MDPFTQRMLERARARQEKIDQKLVSSGQTPKRKPLTENTNVTKSPAKSPSKITRDTVLSPQKSNRESLNKVMSPKRTSQDNNKSDSPAKANRKSILKNSMSSPQRAKNDVIVTKKEFNCPRKAGNRRNSDVSVEINIMHRDDIQIEVQVEENEVPMNVHYDNTSDSGSSVIVKEIEDKPAMNKESHQSTDSRSDRAGLRHNMKSRLDRLGNLYSDAPNLSSPIHRTESDFTAGTPPADKKQPVEQKKPGERGKKFGRLAALADQINNWEDDLTHHVHQAPDNKKKPTKQLGAEILESSTVDVSIHSINDINKVLSGTAKATSCKSKVNTQTYTKDSSDECQRLNNKIVAELEGDGYRRVSASQSRLVYDFTSATIVDPVRQEPKRVATTLSAPAAPNMAAMVANAPAKPPTIAKKPSIKKYKAPTPPSKIDDDDESSESDKDKENNVLEVNDNEPSCVQTKPEPEKPAAQGSPAAKRLVPKLNGNPDRGSVLSKAAMFEAGSPRAKEKDPAEMSLRERKALFEKNKGAAIIPKAPFGLAPSAKTLHGDNNKANRAVKPVVKPVNGVEKQDSDTASSRSNSKDSLHEDNISQNSVGGGIKGKLAALFSKEQTISESTIANKFKQEREKEMEMLQNRFQYKPKSEQSESNQDSDDDQSEHEASEKAPLMGSTTSLFQANKKPEIIANVPKVEKKEEPKDESEDDKVVSQPVKRRSSQDSPVVLSVLEDVKRIKVNNNKKEAQTNGAVVQQPTLYPHLSDIETDNSHNNEEYSDCGGSSDERSKENLNKSENWADTSFGREVLNVVKKNNTSYKKAVRESDSESGGSACDSELDDMLDEALKEESEGPTPPKLNKATLSSNSFVYEQKKFKSPLKPTPAPVTPRPDRGNELVHSVSFYRRNQNASAPSTPIRTIRHASPEPPPSREEPTVNVTTVRRRIKELQAEISKQHTVMSQASQALNLCAATIEFSGSPEQAEGERLLLLASHRRQACLHEVQRLQVEGAGEAAEAGMATLHIQALRINLTRDYIRKLNADGAVGHHAVCLLKCRDRVLATSMQLTSPKSNILHFPDEIRMDGLTSDFKVTVEVYLLQASKEVLPHDVKYHINSKKSNSKLLTPKSKVSELKAPRVQSPAGPMSVRSPQFQPHGYCIFALPQANRKSFTLNKVPHGSPLEGTITLDIKARVLVSPMPPHAGFLTAFSDVSGLGAWHRRWFLVDSTQVLYWKYPDDVQKKLPIGDIDLKTVLSEKVIKAPRDLCARPHTLYFESSIPPGFIVPDNGSLIYDRKPDGTVVRRYLLAADTAKDRDTWLECLNKALEYVRCSNPDDSDAI